MPTYSYQCRSCTHRVEAFQKISDQPLTLCPKCQTPSLERGIGGGQVFFHFKGRGFYQTDYKKCHSGSCCPRAKSKAPTPPSKS